MSIIPTKEKAVSALDNIKRMPQGPDVFAPKHIREAAAAVVESAEEANTRLTMDEETNTRLMKLAKHVTLDNDPLRQIANLIGELRYRDLMKLANDLVVDATAATSAESIAAWLDRWSAKMMENK